MRTLIIGDNPSMVTAMNIFILLWAIAAGASIFWPGF